MPNFIPSFDQWGDGGNEHPLLGSGPMQGWGRTVPDGDASPWKTAGIGTVYIYNDGAGNVKYYRKIKDDGSDEDWWADFCTVSERVTYADFTDGGAAAGTYASTLGIPAGAVVLYSLLTDVVAFSGDTSCVLDVGDGSDDDRYTAGAALSIFATNDEIADAGGAPQGTAYHSAAKTFTFTATAGSDWGAVASTGAFTFTVVYRMTCV
jgi:hypothetical protein